MEIKSKKVYSFLKSIFRFDKMISKNAPKTLLDMEKSIMNDRIKQLSPEEIHLAIISWQKFYDNQLVIDEIEDNECIKDLNSYFSKLN